MRNQLLSLILFSCSQLIIAQNTIEFYAEDFDASDGGWTSAETVDEDEAWAYGTSSFAGNTTGHIFIDPYNNYNNDMDLSIQSPIMDFSGRSGMDLSFSLRYNTERRYDGAQVLYSIDGGGNWTILGAVGDGTNWYNDTDVDGIANNEDGWSNDNGSWQTSSITLPAALDGESNVRFRFRFGSDYSVTDDGVAFDDWLIMDGATTVYSEDFNASNGGWGGLLVSNGYSWTRGVAVTGNATNHFYTDPYNDYGNKMMVALTSPTIDFTGVYNSDFSFNLNYATESGWDGLQVKYSVDDGDSWSLLGVVGDGTNWFNDTDVDAFENNADGWSGDNVNWAISSISLPDATDNQDKVRFQFLFASDGSVTADGVGVDDVSITFEAPFITTTTGDYNVSGTWFGGGIPGVNDTLYVDENDNLSLSADQTAAMVVVRDGGILTLNSSELELNLGSIVLQGSGAVNCGTGSIEYSRLGDQDIAALDYHHLILSGSGTKSVSLRTNVASNLTLDNGSVVLNTNDSLVLVSTGWSTAGRLTEVPSGATIVGDVEVQRWVGASARKWWHLSSPHSDATADEWQSVFPITGDFTGADDLGGSNNASGYWYDESVIDANSGVGWTEFPSSVNTESIVAGRGYRMFVRQDGSTPLGNSTIKLTGTLNTGTISLPVSYNTVDPSDTAAAGWCFVGNPYASEIDWENAGWTKTDVADGIYVWDAIGGLYRTFVNNVPLNGGSPVISSGQSFWVRAIASSADLQVTEQVKTTTVGTFSKPTTTPDNLLYVTIRDGQDEAEMALRFMEEATSKYDPAYDGYYFGGTSPVNLCTYDDDYVYYAVNSLPLSSDTEVPVYIVHPDEERSYELQFDNLGSFEDDPGLKLVDLYLGETMDLFDGFVYEFDYDGSPSSNGASRFVIQKTTPTITSDVDGNEVEPEGFRVFPNPVQGEDVVSVLLPFDSNGELKVIDIEGRVIFSEIISSISSYNMVLEDLQSGVYLVSYVTDSSQFSERLIVE